jgi:hypothetical protein
VGTFALHGLAMKWMADPLVASKLVSALFCLMPLAGLFIFSLGFFNDRRPACAAVLVGAPLWLHLILSTGPMSEMPATTFMLTAAGLLLLGLRRPPSKDRFWMLTASACFFNLAILFHLTCWIQLGAVLTGLLVWPDRPFSMAPVADIFSGRLGSLPHLGHWQHHSFWRSFL